MLSIDKITDIDSMVNSIVEIYRPLVIEEEERTRGTLKEKK